MPIGATGGKFIKIVNLFVYFQRKYGKDIHALIPTGKSKNFQLIFTKFSFSVMSMGGKFPRLPPFPTPLSCSKLEICWWFGRQLRSSRFTSSSSKIIKPQPGWPLRAVQYAQTLVPGRDYSLVGRCRSDRVHWRWAQPCPNANQRLEMQAKWQ